MARNIHHTILFPACFGRFDNLLHGKTVVAARFKLRVWNPGRDLLQPAMDAFVECLAEARHPAHNTVTQNRQFRTPAWIKSKLFEEIFKHKAAFGPHYFATFQIMRRIGVVAAREMTDHTILEQDIDLRIRPADALPVRAVFTRRTVEKGLNLACIPAVVAHDVKRMGMKGPDMEPWGGFVRVSDPHRHVTDQGRAQLAAVEPLSGSGGGAA